MSQQAEETIQRFAVLHGFPVFKEDANGNATLLIVLLTQLSDDDKNKLVLHYQRVLPDNTTIRTWCPSNRTLRCIAYQDAHRDSQANIYGLAVLAYRAGWSSFVVADELTKRQLIGNLRVGEKPMISIVMVRVRQRASTDTLDNSLVCVIAKRTVGTGEEENAKILETLPTIEPEVSTGSDLFEAGRAYERGLILHDPDKPLFSVDNAVDVGREKYLDAIETTLGTELHLPQELMDNIVSNADVDIARDPLLVPLWVQENKTCLSIFSLMPATEEKVCMLQSAIQSSLHSLNKKKNNSNNTATELTLHFVPWQCTRPASRRDLMNMWAKYRAQIATEWAYYPVMHVLVEPFKDEHSTSFATAFWDASRPTILKRTGLEYIIDPTNPHRMGLRERREFLNNITYKEDQSEEVLYNPDQPFYVNPAAWLAASRTANTIPVFYLTNKLTKKEDDAIRAEIATLADVDVLDEKQCCYVPWKTGKEDEPDGTVEDMWEIFWMVYTHNGGRDNAIPVLFIDRQSGSDMKTILTDTDSYYCGPDRKIPEILRGVPYPTLRGLLYGRIPGRESHIAHANLNIANMDFVDFMEMFDGEERKFPRPGWPGHGVLEDAVE